MLTLRARYFELTERAVLWSDALGLGLFSASGAQIALDMQMPAIVAVLMGVITAVFGGDLRDIVSMKFQALFGTIDPTPFAPSLALGRWYWRNRWMPQIGWDWSPPLGQLSYCGAVVVDLLPTTGLGSRFLLSGVVYYYAFSSY
jgi:hypothetical protein